MITRPPKQPPSRLPPIPDHIPTRDELLRAAAEAEASASGPKNKPLPKWNEQ